MTKRRLRLSLPIPRLGRVGRLLFRSQVLTVWLGLCALGFVVGIQARPATGSVPFEELFENMSVLSYREAPSDSAARFVVELSARGRVFREYDVDSRRFVAPERGRDYRRAISGTRYPPLRVRGHVSRGCWLELPGAAAQSLLPDQFDELYRTTLDFVKPVSIATNVLGILSGYSIGYRMATWSTSLSNPAVQERVLALPGMGRRIAREAWRRVLLEPVVMGQESDAARFAALRGTQRIYTNFFRLAVNDTNEFIPHEIARLDSAGCTRESRAMLAFAQAVRRAAQDTSTLTSADFSAVEDWASLLDRHGHWAYRSVPPLAGGRLQYFGMLAWYGLAPAPSDPRRIWVGPRLLVRSADTEGFIADDIPSIGAGCPVAWTEWLHGKNSSLASNAWTAQWMAESRQFAPIVDLCMGIVGFVRGAGDDAEAEDSSPGAVAGAPATPRAAQAAGAGAAVTSPPAALSPGAAGGAEAPAGTPGGADPSTVAPAPDLRRVYLPDSALADTTRTARSLAQLPDSAAKPGTGRADSVGLDPDGTIPDLRLFRANMGGLGR